MKDETEDEIKLTWKDYFSFYWAMLQLHGALIVVAVVIGQTFNWGTLLDQVLLGALACAGLSISATMDIKRVLIGIKASSLSRKESFDD